jgi:hypothetical protein
VGSAGRALLSSCYSRGFRHVVTLSVILAIFGCVPTRSTIGGHDEEELKKWAVQAAEMCRQRTGQEPPNAFTTDGCTLSPDGTWQSCCVDHDMVYWCGGSSAARCLADEKFRSCIAEKGGGVTAAIMYWGVRLGGNPWLPTYWRWGYGWSWPRGYTDD